MGDPSHPRPWVAPQLAGMMFLTYFGIGAWIVPLGRYLPTAPAEGGLGFDPAGVALIYSAWPLAAMTTPLLIAPLADRFFAAERMLGVLNLVQSGFLCLAGWWCGRPEAVGNPWPLFFIALLFGGALLPTVSLSTVIGMRNLSDPVRQFGRVRLVGTFGWIVAGLILAAWVNPVSPQPFFLAAGAVGLLGALAFVGLPHTPPLGRHRPVRDVIGLSALAMFKDRAFVGFAIATLVGNMLNQFYVMNANRFLTERGFARPEGLLTLAQFCEMGCMAVVPLAVGRWGLRPVMLAGLIGWVVRNLVLGFGPDSLVLLVALPLHGFCYTAFSIVGQLFVDREAPPHLRASAQALLTFLSSGPAALVGYWLTSTAGRHYTTSTGTDWTGFWTVPAVGCLVAVWVFAGLFREPPVPGTGERGASAP